MSKWKYFGEMPVREDIKVKPESIFSKIRRRVVYHAYQLTDLIPSVKLERDRLEQEWQRGFEAHCEEEMSHRRELWAQGIPTYMLPLGLGYRRPRPRPMHPNPFRGWENVEFSMRTIRRNDETHN